MDRVADNYGMKYGWAGLGGAVILVVAGFYSYRAVARHHQTVQLAGLSQQYLKNEAKLPARSAWRVIDTITVPGTQARVLASTLAAEQGQVGRLLHITLTTVRVRLAQAAVTSRNPLTLAAKVAIVRRYRPKGSTQWNASGLFQFAGGTVPHLVKVTLTTNRSSSPTGPDTFNLNLWNMVPAGPLPHGS